MSVSLICVQKKLMKENEDLFASISEKKTILTCECDVFDTSVAEEYCYVLKSSNEIQAYYNEVCDRHIKLNKVVVIHSEESVLKQAKETGFKTVAISDTKTVADTQYASIEEMFIKGFKVFKKKERLLVFFTCLSLLCLLGTIAFQSNPIILIAFVVGMIASLTLAIYVYPEKTFWKIVEFFLDGIMG